MYRDDDSLGGRPVTRVGQRDSRERSGLEQPDARADYADGLA